jgi:hypothetical protein
MQSSRGRGARELANVRVVQDALRLLAEWIPTPLSASTFTFLIRGGRVQITTPRVPPRSIRDVERALPTAAVYL